MDLIKQYFCFVSVMLAMNSANDGMCDKQTVNAIVGVLFKLSSLGILKG
jgi:hypothetical protein